MTQYRITRSAHDSGICAAIGAAVGQSGWSIVHIPDGDHVILSFPDSVAASTVAAAVAAYTPDTTRDRELDDIQKVLAKADADITAQEFRTVALRVMRRMLGKGR